MHRYREYVAVNKKRRAEMLVHVNCDSTGAKQFTILSEGGSGSIRKHVFHKLLREEEEANPWPTASMARQRTSEDRR
ncbi:MAG TPA: hypothetical protein VGV15_01120 [Terriglobales bacterium]|nr:hypothetical protein [Terriglobales bacterium]